MKISSLKLNPPFLPQSLDGVIDVNLVQNDVMQINVPHYKDEVPYDVVVVSVGSINSTPLIIYKPFQEYYILRIPFTQIPDGSYQVTYKVTDSAHNVSLSEATQVSIVNSTSNQYPAPLYPNAVGGVITSSILEQYQGVNVKIIYPLEHGDELKFVWKGYNSSGVEIPYAAWTCDHTVTEQDQHKGYIDLKVPQDNLAVVGSGGLGCATYYVGAKSSSSGVVAFLINEFINTPITFSCYVPGLLSEVLTMPPLSEPWLITQAGVLPENLRGSFASLRTPATQGLVIDICLGYVGQSSTIGKLTFPAGKTSGTFELSEQSVKPGDIITLMFSQDVLAIDSIASDLFVSVTPRF